MATASTDSLISQAKCIDQCIPRGMQMAVLIAIFAKLAGMSVTDTNALIALAKCIDGCVPPGMQISILNALANQIVSAGSGCLTCGTGAPTSVPTGGCCLYIQTDSIPPGTIWQYYSGAWH